MVMQRQTKSPGENGGVTLHCFQAHEVLHNANQHVHKVSLAPEGSLLLGANINFEN